MGHPPLHDQSYNISKMNICNIHAVNFTIYFITIFWLINLLLLNFDIYLDNWRGYKLPRINFP